LTPRNGGAPCHCAVRATGPAGERARQVRRRRRRWGTCCRATCPGGGARCGRRTWRGRDRRSWPDRVPAAGAVVARPFPAAIPAAPRYSAVPEAPQPRHHHAPSQPATAPARHRHGRHLRSSPRRPSHRAAFGTAGATPSRRRLHTESPPRSGPVARHRGRARAGRSRVRRGTSTCRGVPAPADDDANDNQRTRGCNRHSRTKSVVGGCRAARPGPPLQ